MILLIWEDLCQLDMGNNCFIFHEPFFPSWSLLLPVCFLQTPRKHRCGWALRKRCAPKTLPAGHGTRNGDTETSTKFAQKPRRMACNLKANEKCQRSLAMHIDMQRHASLEVLQQLKSGNFGCMNLFNWLVIRKMLRIHSQGTTFC